MDQLEMGHNSSQHCRLQRDETVTNDQINLSTVAVGLKYLQHQYLIVSK